MAVPFGYPGALQLLCTESRDVWPFYDITAPHLAHALTQGYSYFGSNPIKRRAGHVLRHSFTESSKKWELYTQSLLVIPRKTIRRAQCLCCPLGEYYVQEIYCGLRLFRVTSCRCRPLLVQMGRKLSWCS